MKKNSIETKYNKFMNRIAPTCVKSNYMRYKYDQNASRATSVRRECRKVIHANVQHETLQPYGDQRSLRVSPSSLFTELRQEWTIN